LKKELDEAVSSSSETNASLLQAQEQLRSERDSLKTELEKAQKERVTNANKVEELTGKLAALTLNLNAMAEQTRTQDEQLQAASKKEAKLNTAEAELASLREQVNKLKLEQTKSSSLLSRLQAEKDASERKSGQRTALVGMLESQLAELNERNTDSTAKLEAAMYDLSQRDDTIQEMTEELEKTKKELHDAKTARRQASESLSSAQKGMDTKKAKMIESLQREVQSLQQQMARKSAAAQKLIQEREKECAELRKTNNALQQEVDKGTLSDRRIFELAAKQSNRESVAHGEIEIRDKVVERLSEALLNRDAELASAEHNVQRVEGQVEELCRVRRREDVNLDFLKSTVVKFLSKPPGSSERAALLPVLATLLQFDQNDYAEIEAGKNKVSWWGSVAPVLISAPSETPAPPLMAAPRVTPSTAIGPTRGGGTSAEVKISKTAPDSSEARRGSRTSLQF
jgi:chromosome segregation ATPase